MWRARMVLLATIVAAACGAGCWSPWTAGATAAGGPLRWSSAAVGERGDVVTTTHPTAGSKAWHVASVDRHALYAISRASARLCAALDQAGRVLVSTNPGHPRSWAATELGSGLTDVGCSSSRL